MRLATNSLFICSFVFLFVSCFRDNPDEHAYISLSNNSNIPIAISCDEVVGSLNYPPMIVDPYESIESESTWEWVQLRTQRIIAPHTRSDNYLHYFQRHPSIFPSGWESSLSEGYIFLYIIDASEPNEDVKKEEYGKERLLGVYTFYLEDLKDIDFHVIYPPDETFKKYWIAPPQ